VSDEGIQRFDIPVSKKTLLEKYRAMRMYFAKVAESQGKTLDPSWYEDGPEQMPQLYKDQPHLLPKPEE
jgi:hypothetical protein